MMEKEINPLEALADMLTMLKGLSKGPPRMISRTGVGGLVVSTVDATDLGPETAIVDTVGAHPVERYESWVDASEGHKRWVAFLERGERNVTKFGYGTTIEDEEIVLEE